MDGGAPEAASLEEARALVGRDPVSAVALCRARVAVTDGLERAQWRLVEGKGSQALSEYNNAHACFADALEVFEAHSEDEGAALCINGLGAVALARGDWNAAFAAFQQAFSRHSAGGRERAAADALNNLAATHYLVGQYAQGLEAQLRALTVQRRIGDESGEAKSLHNIALTHAQLGEHAQALECLERALDLHTSLGDGVQQAQAINAMTESLEAVGRLDEVPALLERALLLARSAHDRTVVGITLVNLGITDRKLGRVNTARDALERGVAVGRELEDWEIVSGALTQLAWLSFEASDHHEALRLATEALSTAQRLDTVEPEASARTVLARIAETLEDWRSFAAQLQRLRELDERVHEQRNEERARRLSYQFQTEQAKRDAELTRAQNKHLETLNLALRDANALNVELLSALEAHNTRLERQSLEDALTGLGNRRFFEHSLARETGRARREARSLSLAIVDIDRFKTVNDTHSHQVGDEVLRVVAAILRANVRGGDIVARYGGEEFVVLCPDTGREAGLALGERVRSAVEHHDWAHVATGLRITVSLGLGSAGDAASLETLFATADAALYRAKREGRNRVR
jgi:diguanylate cyclase (GGDEF)-like protein